MSTKPKFEFIITATRQISVRANSEDEACEAVYAELGQDVDLKVTDCLPNESDDD